MQIVLVGQPNLRNKLASPELVQLRQRITVSYHLQPLDAAETANYVNHRLRRAALGTPLEFGRDVTDAVYARSGGVPRVINVICDAALVFGYAEEQRQIDVPLVAEVLAELEATGVLAPADGAVATEPAVVPAVALAPRQAAASPVAVAPSALSPALTTFVDTGPRQEQLEAQAAELRQREVAVQQRERELADQRRILAAQYRLLRPHRPAAPPRQWE